jgi:hypothetical protein
MIPRVHRRRASVAEVLHYLFGPGEYRDHREPRVVAAWAYATTGGVDELQPAMASGRRVLRRMVELLEQPVVAGVNPPGKPVWHGSLHNHADDPLLSDGRWAQIAGEFMAAVGLAPNGDLDAVRWLGIRHGADHVHLVATLVRQDGRTVWGGNDYRLAQAAARDLEDRYALHPVGRGDRAR